MTKAEVPETWTRPYTIEESKAAIETCRDFLALVQRERFVARRDPTMNYHLADDIDSRGGVSEGFARQLANAMGQNIARIAQETTSALYLPQNAARGVQLVSKDGQPLNGHHHGH